MIDTLILSGGGPSGISYIGIFKALLEKNKIIKSELKEIIVTSVGIIFAVLYLLDFTPSQMEEIILETELEKILDTRKLKIDDLLLNYGLFTNQIIGDSINSFCKHRIGKEKITLKELYDKIPIKLTVKVYNTNLGKIEYFSHESEPDIQLYDIARITTAIPFLFQPIKYKGHLYVDGGVKGHFPIEKCQSDNYLGIVIEGGTCNPENFKIIQTFPILGYIMNLMNDRDNNLENYDLTKIMIMDINVGLNFSLDKDMKTDIIKQGYDKCIEFLTED